MMNDYVKTTVRQELADEIRANCRKLRLSQNFAENVLACGDEKLAESIKEILHKEVTSRYVKKVASEIERAGFPCQFSPADFDASEVSVVGGITVEQLMELPFCKEGKAGNVMIYGGPGTGKTMFSIILGSIACRQGLTARFMRMALLMEELMDAQEKDQLPRYIRKYSRTKVLILDEFAYTPYTLSEVRLFYRLLSRISEKTSVILNTTLNINKWAEMIPDDRLASSIGGKIMQDCTVLIFRGHDRRFDVISGG